MLLPYTAKSFPLRIRGRATGWVAACSKLGGVFAQALAIMAIMPTLAVSALAIAVPMALSLLLTARFGRETRGADLHDLDPEGHVFDKSGFRRECRPSRDDNLTLPNPISLATQSGFRRLGEDRA